MPKCRDSQHFHSVANFPRFWATSADRGREEGKTVIDFYKVQEKQNQVPIIRISWVGARKRKE